MKLIIASNNEIEKIMDLIQQAKEYLRKNEINQWQNGYPDRACIEKDIKRKVGYLCIDAHDIVGYVCIDFNGESAYSRLNGEWKSHQPYAVIHRLTIENSYKGKGIVSKIFLLLKNYVEKKISLVSKLILVMRIKQ